MAVFCAETGVRILAPNGDYHERSDVVAFRAKHNRFPVCKGVDPAHGWDERQPDPPKPTLKDEILEALTEPKPAAPNAGVRAETSQKPASKGGK